MLILKINPENLDKIVKAVARAIKKGNVIISPTDTVYGLLADVANKKAVGKIFKIKKRNFQKPISVFVRDLKMAKKIAKIDKTQEKFLKKVWPGKAIVILKSKRKFPKGIVCQKGKVGLRIPRYKLLDELLKKINVPIAQTSANISGRSDSTKIKEVISQFKKQKIQPDLVISAGNLKRSSASTVIDFTSRKIKIIREGELKINGTKSN